MDHLSWVFLHLYYATCFRLCLSHINISHFLKTNSKQVCVASEVIVPRGRSLLFCASLCGRHSQCIGYRFSADGNCYIGACHHGNGQMTNASSGVTYIQKGAARCGRVTCNKDYRTHSENTVCQSTGRRGTVELGCRRYRWKNPPRTHDFAFNETIPFWKEGKDLYVKLKGTPTKNTVFSLGLKQQSDFLFYMSARFHVSYQVKTIVLNTQKAGWGQEIYSRDFPFSVGEFFLLEITYSDGEYKVQENRRPWLTFKDRHPLMRPSSLIIGGDVNVELVELYYK